MKVVLIVALFAACVVAQWTGKYEFENGGVGYQIQVGNNVYGLIGDHTEYYIAKAGVDANGKNTLSGQYYQATGGAGSFEFTDNSAGNDGSSYSGPAYWGDVQTDSTFVGIFSGTRVSTSVTNEEALYTTSTELLSGSYAFDDHNGRHVQLEAYVDFGVFSAAYKTADGYVGLITGWTPDGQHYAGGFDEYNIYNASYHNPGFQLGYVDSNGAFTSFAWKENEDGSILFERTYSNVRVDDTPDIEFAKGKGSSGYEELVAQYYGEQQEEEEGEDDDDDNEDNDETKTIQTQININFAGMLSRAA